MSSTRMLHSLFPTETAVEEKRERRQDIINDGQHHFEVQPQLIDQRRNAAQEHLIKTPLTKVQKGVDGLFAKTVPPN